MEANWKKLWRAVQSWLKICKICFKASGLEGSSTLSSEVITWQWSESLWWWVGDPWVCKMPQLWAGVKLEITTCSVCVSSATWTIAMWMEENVICHLFSEDKKLKAWPRPRRCCCLSYGPCLMCLEFSCTCSDIVSPQVHLWWIFMLAAQHIPRNNTGFFLSFRQHCKQSVHQLSVICLCWNFCAWCISHKSGSQNSFDTVDFVSFLSWKYPSVHEKFC